MSYDLLVWEGERPETEAAAIEIITELMERMEDVESEPASPAIAAYVSALLQRWPDITTDEGENSPWADGPLIGNAFGSAIYFSMVWSRAKEASAFAAAVAAEHGLLCFDPQSEELRPRASRGWFSRFRRRSG